MTAEDEQPDDREGEDAPAADVPESSEQPAAEQPAAEARPPHMTPRPTPRSRTAGAEESTPEAPRKRGVRRPRRKQAAAEGPTSSSRPPKAPKPPPRKPKARKRRPRTAAKAKAPAARGGKVPARARRRVVRARARYVRTSARKARMVCGHLRGKSVHEARAILAFTPREAARDWSKLLESAVANAESNHELLEEDLIVREAYADEGPTIKRFRPRAMGRATPIAKRTSHLTIALALRPEAVVTTPKKRKKD